MLLLACLQELSGSCESNLHCDAPEICAKGVCMGAQCAIDDDCEPGWECAEVFGSRTCLVSCADDDSCLGETTCREVPRSSGAQSESLDYCL